MPHVDENAALSRLQSILDQPQYAGGGRPWWDDLVRPLADAVSSALAQIWELLSSASSGREGTYGWSVLAICAILVLTVAVYLTRTVGIAVRADQRVSTRGHAERRERSERYWTEAQTLAAAGHLDEAMRAMYLSALYALDERTLLHVENGLTNREHAHLLDRHPPVANAFSAVVEVYDRLRYGGAAVTASAVSDFQMLVALSRQSALGESRA